MAASVGNAKSAYILAYDKRDGILDLETGDRIMNTDVPTP